MVQRVGGAVPRDCDAGRDAVPMEPGDRHIVASGTGRPKGTTDRAGSHRDPTCPPVGCPARASYRLFALLGPTGADLLVHTRDLPLVGGFGIAPSAFRDAVDILCDGRAIEALEWAFIKPWERLNPLGRALWYIWGLEHLAAAGLMTLGIWRLRQSPTLALAPAATILLTTGPPGPIGYVRFRVPVLPLITALEVAGMAWLGSQLRPLPLPTTENDAE